MKKIHALTAAAGIVLALTGSGFAASRSHAVTAEPGVNTVRTYGDRDEANPPYGGGYDAYARGSFEQPQQYTPGYAPGQYTPSQNLPYADRPYGDPDGW